MRVAVVAAFGALGAVARYGVASAVGERTFPVGTLAINVVGSFLLGWLLGSDPSADVRAALGVGFLGAFTTFSTFAVETDRLARGSAVLYVALSIVLGVGAAVLGRVVATR